MQVVYAHEKPADKSSLKIFLAGPSPRNETDYSWRPEALTILEQLGFQGVVYVPLPRDGKWLDNYDAQVDWELTYLDDADVIAFWIPRSDSLPGFTTNVEFGLYVKSGKVVLGYPPGTPKTRYLHQLAEREGVPIEHSLLKTLAQAIQML